MRGIERSDGASLIARETMELICTGNVKPNDLIIGVDSIRNRSLGAALSRPRCGERCKRACAVSDEDPRIVLRLRVKVPHNASILRDVQGVCSRGVRNGESSDVAQCVADE